MVLVRATRFFQVVAVALPCPDAPSRPTEAEQKAWDNGQSWILSLELTASPGDALESTGTYYEFLDSDELLEAAEKMLDFFPG